MSAHTAVRIEGGLLSPDLVETITGRQGQKPADFGVDGRRSVLDEATAAWADARLYWKAYQARLARQSGESPVTATREQWAIPLLEALGYHLTYQRRAAEAGERRYALSHRAGEDEAAPPVHIVGYDEELGKRSLSRATQMTPHALLQDYLNRSEHLWGVVTNGYQLRLLRDSSHFSRPAYIEFDLQSMFAGDQLDEFLLLYRLAHRTRLPRGVDDAPQCLLEQYHQDAIEEGGRIREGLREAVETSIQTLANGFLAHRRNEPLRAAVRGGRLSPDALYKELLYLIYRLLFLMVAEERNLLQAGGDGARAAYDTYQRHWSISRLRALAEEPLNAPQRFDDLYLGLRALFTALRSPDMCAPLGLAPLNGELFEPLEYLDAACLNNRDLLDAVREMSFFLPRDERVRRRVNYGALDVEELGSVYEALLDYQPVLDTPPGGAPEFSFTHGTTRKSTGSYYTRPELVKELVESALVPVMEARLREAGAASEARQEALLSLTVCDPACGSGHFLLAAARRIGTELARTRAGDTEPSPEEVRLGVRDAITHCIYGVDRNPLAVDLCKVALWIEGYARGKPLTFLDYRIRCGDSLVGVFDLEVLKAGIPDGAYTAVSGDDKAIARGLRERNARERAGQLPLAADGSRFMVQDVLTARHDLLRLPEDTPDQVTRKRDTLKHLQLSAAWQGLQEACHLWTAAFFAPFTREGAPRVPTTAAVRGCLHGVRVAGPVMGAAVEAATRLRFFHWPLEFPEVMLERGGFDVVLGNPPWEMIQLEEQEFFATRSTAIATAPNKAARQRLIRALEKANLKLWLEYSEALHDASALSILLRTGERFPLTGRGRINTYAVFAEQARNMLGARGRAGIIVPTGIATDNTTSAFFGDLVKAGQLASLFDFENRERLFADVDSRYKFSLVTLAGPREAADAEEREMRFAFFLTQPAQLGDLRRVFALTPDDFRRINPNTLTCPIFRTRADAELTRRIYRRVPVLVNEATGENPWGVSFKQGLFNMSSDSHLFRTREELEAQGYRLAGNRLVRGREVYLPLYEAKMMWQFDHRFSSYDGVASRSSTNLPEATEAQHAAPGYQVLPWYWVAEGEVQKQLGGWQRGWLLGFRDITNATNERTAIFSLLPAVAIGHKLPLLFIASSGASAAAYLMANVDSLVLDFVARQKIGGTSMSYFHVKQLTIQPPVSYNAVAGTSILPRVMELVCTAWDLKPFADDVWAESDAALRVAIDAQRAANARATGGHSWDSAPPWVDRSVGFPPFRWDSDRRAVLRAELDALYARLYGLTRDELRYILDPQDVYGPDFPGETFRVLKGKEMRAFGEYRTRRLVLEAWDRMEG